MRRCFVDQDVFRQKISELPAGEAHHLLNVLRVKKGDEIEVFDGRGRTARAALLSARKDSAVISILSSTIRRADPPAPAVVLIQALPKHSGLDAIVQKATELGVHKIIPAVTDRVIVKISGRAADEKVARWRKIILAAAKQSRTAWLPEINPIVSLAEAVREVPCDLRIFGSLAPQAPLLREVMAKVGRPGPGSIALAIGPEGDLTDEEQGMLVGANFKPASFGTEVLRVETAAVFGLSALNYEFRR
ncbi:MAG: RsmE family RNA methyltransferase [Kiritimatiellae bacterium]|nr:RsmE family RNA methyltransferase [Kiritimatiellia bacterium]